MFFCSFPEFTPIWIFFFVAGAAKILHFPFTHGTPVVVMPRFEPIEFCANIERYKISLSLVVPPVLVLLARHPGWSLFTQIILLSLTESFALAVDQYDFSTMKCLFSGAAPLGAALSKAVRLKSFLSHTHRYFMC